MEFYGSLYDVILQRLILYKCFSQFFKNYLHGEQNWDSSECK